MTNISSSNFLLRAIIDHLSRSLPISSICKAVVSASLIPFAMGGASSIQAQSCENIPSGGGESISAEITIDGTSTLLDDLAIVRAGTRIRIDSHATAFGECTEMFDDGSSCVPTGYVYNRTVNHISVRVDASTAGSVNGNYSVGSVFGRNPNGTTAYWQDLDSKAAISTGPNYYTLYSPGTYQFHITSTINKTICNIEPGEIETDVTIYVAADDDSVNAGSRPCNETVGEPINVTNGNVYIQQTDYRLPGLGEGLEITRTYNSNMQRAGIFGYGWSSAEFLSNVVYDEASGGDPCLTFL